MYIIVMKGSLNEIEKIFFENKQYICIQVHILTTQNLLISKGWNAILGKNHKDTLNFKQD